MKIPENLTLTEIDAAIKKTYLEIDLIKSVIVNLSHTQTATAALLNCLESLRDKVECLLDDLADAEEKAGKKGNDDA